MEIVNNTTNGVLEEKLEDGGLARINIAIVHVDGKPVELNASFYHERRGAERQYFGSAFLTLNEKTAYETLSYSLTADAKLSLGDVERILDIVLDEAAQAVCDPKAPKLPE